MLAAPSSLQGAPWATPAPPPAIRFVSGNRLLSAAPDWLWAKTQFSAQSSCISGPLSLSPPTSPLIAICSVLSFSNTAEHGEAAAWEPGREEGKRAPVPCSESAGPALCPVSCPCVCVCVCVCVYPEPDRHEHVVIQAPAGSDQGIHLYQAPGHYHSFNPCNNVNNCRCYHCLRTGLTELDSLAQDDTRRMGQGHDFHLGLFDCWGPSPSHETFSPFGF